MMMPGDAMSLLEHEIPVTHMSKSMFRLCRAAARLAYRHYGHGGYYDPEYGGLRANPVLFLFSPARSIIPQSERLQAALLSARGSVFDPFDVTLL